MQMVDNGDNCDNGVGNGWQLANYQPLVVNDAWYWWITVHGRRNCSLMADSGWFFRFGTYIRAIPRSANSQEYTPSPLLKPMGRHTASWLHGCKQQLQSNRKMPKVSVAIFTSAAVSSGKVKDWQWLIVRSSDFNGTSWKLTPTSTKHRCFMG